MECFYRPSIDDRRYIAVSTALDDGLITARNIDLKREKLFLAFLMNRCIKGTVRLEKKLGTYDFLCFFHALLTDRGSEFGGPVSIEDGMNEIERTNIYYCDPMRSGQKGGVGSIR